jgi:GrpB-like predicted nucleotidyltransferase (UPF0157 family)
MLGVAQGTVRLEEYDPRWPELAGRELQRVGAALGPLVQRIEHIGSTAVPGLPAKPILDLALEVESADQLPALAIGLAGLGYRAWGEHGLPGRQFFSRGEPVTHHVHAVVGGSPHWAVWLRFRDRLRADAADRAAYAACKRQLARAHPDDRRSYTRGKDDLVTAILARASALRIDETG